MDETINSKGFSLTQQYNNAYNGDKNVGYFTNQIILVSLFENDTAMMGVKWQDFIGIEQDGEGLKAHETCFHPKLADKWMGIPPWKLKRF